MLRLLAAGRTNAQIGAELYISPRTAGVHVTSILRKLGSPAGCRPPRWPNGPACSPRRGPKHHRGNLNTCGLPQILMCRSHDPRPPGLSRILGA